MRVQKRSGIVAAAGLGMLLCLGAVGAEAGKVEPGEGYRGMALNFDSDQTQFIETGDRIDILVTFEAVMKDDKKEKVTATILQNVVVLEKAVSQANAARSVLLLNLNPNEAQYLALSIDGDYELRVISRRTGDKEMKPMEMASFRKLFR